MLNGSRFTATTTSTTTTIQMNEEKPKPTIITQSPLSPVLVRSLVVAYLSQQQLVVCLYCGDELEIIIKINSL